MVSIADYGSEKLLLSFILPVYNVAKWLPDCLDSLLAQDIPQDTYEIICVNDGSPDNSRDIILEYASKYPNIKLIDKPNGGVSSARNAGIDAAQGEYIWFVDPDDKIRANILGSLFANVTDEDVVYFAIEDVAEDDIGLSDCSEDLRYYSDFQIIGSSSDPEFRHLSLAVGNSACLCIIKRSFIINNGFRFDEQLAYGEDTYFCFLLESHSSSAAYIDSPLYLYRKCNSSAMHSKSKNSMLKHSSSMQRLSELYKEQLCLHGDEYSDLHKMRLGIKINNCAESALFSILPLDKATFNERLSFMKSQSVYPYSFRKENLDLKQYPSLKLKLLALMKYPLPIEAYARTAAFVFRHIGKPSE